MKNINILRLTPSGSPDNVRKDYQEKMNAFLANLDQTFRQAQVDFLRLSTTDSLARALANYLHKRDAMR